MPFVPDQPASAAGRFVPDDDVIKDVKAATKPAPKPKKSSLPGWVDNLPPLGVAEATANMASGALAKPAGDLAGLATLLGKIPGVKRDNAGFDPAEVKRKVQEAMTYEPRTNAGRMASQYNPMALLAKLWSAGARGAGNMTAGRNPDPLHAAVGSGVEETINQLPQLVGVGKAGAVGDAAKAGARDLVQSALKPDKAAREMKLPVTGRTKADSAVDTVLKEGVNVTRGGAEKLRDRISGIDDQIDTMVNQSSATIDKKVVASYLHDSVKRFEKQVTPLDDLAQIQKTWDEFLAVHPDKITVKDAQALKRGTYKALGDKSYGELKGAAVEAQKTLARGLKEEIEKQLPQVRPLGAEQSQLINALSLVEKRAILEANKNPMGLALVAADKSKLAAFMADRSGLFKSLVGRMLNAGGTVAPAALPALGAAVTSQASQPQGQLPPPPPQ